MFSSWVVSTIVIPSRVEVGEQVEDVVAGLEVDAARRLVEEQEAPGRAISARARKTRCCWPPDSSRMWRSRQPADPEPLEQPVDPARDPSARRPGPPRTLRPAAHQDDLADGRREVPVDGLELRHPADAGGRAAADRPAVDGDPALDARHDPDDRPQQRRLAGPRRPDDPDERPARDRQVDVAQDRRSVVAARDVLEPDEGVARPAAGMARGSAAARHGRHVSVTASGSKIDASPPSAPIITCMSFLSMPRYVCSGARGGAGRLVVAELVDERRAGLPRDLLEDRAREDLRAEDRRHLLRPDLLDQAGDLLRARVREVRRLDGADHREAVLARPVRPRVVVGQQLAVPAGTVATPFRISASSWSSRAL